MQPTACQVERVRALEVLRATLMSLRAAGKSSTVRLKMGAWGTVQVVEGRLPVFGTGSSAATAEANALTAIQRITPLLGLTTTDALQLLEVSGRAAGHRAVFRQLHQGVPAGVVVLDLDLSGTVVSLVNHTIPDIREDAFATAAAADAARQTAEQALLQGRPAARDLRAALRYQPSTDRCNPGVLVWRISYQDQGRPRLRVVRAKTGALIKDEAQEWLVGNSRVRRQNCSTWQYEDVYTCQSQTCSQVEDPAARAACEGTGAVWEYWLDQGLHGDDPPASGTLKLTRYSYDANGTCMWVDLVCVEGGGWSGGRTIVGPNYANAGVIGHEFGHALIRYANSAVNEAPLDQDVAVAEHIADVHAMIALPSSVWVVSTNDGEPIRRWDDPSAMSNATRRFPNTFDDYNTHGEPRSMDGGIYRSWHVPSTLWSHLVYNYANLGGVGRTQAIETVYRTIVNEVSGDGDLSFSLYKKHLQDTADTMGRGSQMASAQTMAKLWPTTNEAWGSYAYSRPALVAGTDYWWVWYPFFQIQSAPALKIFFNRYTGSTDEFVEMQRDAQGGWQMVTTSLSPSTVGGAITATYGASNEYFVAWKSWDGSVYTSRRSSFGFSPAWGPLAAVPGVTTDADVALASDGGDVLLFYRDSQSQRLRFVRWQGSGWSTPLAPDWGLDTTIYSGPSVTWDGGRYHIVTLDATGSARTLQLQPTLGGYAWSNPAAFASCFFRTETGRHAWAVMPSPEVANGKLYLIGAGLDGNTLAGEPRVEQAVAKNIPGTSTYDFVDQVSHGQLDQVSHGVDTAVFGGKVWMVNWLGWPYRSWGVTGKTP